MKNTILAHQATVASIPTEAIMRAVNCLVDLYQTGGKLLLAGNGGSAADAQHIAAEFVGRFLIERPPLPAIALSVNTSSVTAIANDYGYDTVFARQVEAYAKKGDVFWGISSSGNSENIIQAMKKATDIGCDTLALTGRNGGKMGALATIHITLPETHTPRIQEAHVLIYHMICDLVEQALFPT